MEHGHCEHSRRGVRLTKIHSLPAGTRQQIKERSVELHQATVVHGDVRDANVMVRKDGKLGFMLVYFD
jgi:Ser/Thr protein kinase RdoA (MazF antagonist)